MLPFSVPQGSLDLIQSIEDDPLLDTQHLPHHSLHAHFRPRFHPLPTVIIANLLLLIHVSWLGESDPFGGDVLLVVMFLKKIYNLFRGQRAVWLYLSAFKVCILFY